jgi:hypothetical protein
MATTRPSPEASSHLHLLIRHHIGDDLVDAEVRPTASAVVQVMPVKA